MTTAFDAPTKQRAKSGAAAKAYLKRQRRTELMGQVRSGDVTDQGSTAAAGPRSYRVPFVLILCPILAACVAGVLVLNTMNDESGLRTARSAETITDLQLEIEQLQAEIADLDNTLAIARAAERLGLVPAGDAAILTLDEKGRVSVLGTPTPVAVPLPAQPDGQAPSDGSPGPADSGQPEGAAQQGEVAG